MKKIAVLLLTLAMVLACNKEDQQKLEQLQKDMEALEAKTVDVAAQTDVTVPDDQPFSISLDKVKYGVDAGGSVSIGYTLQEEATVEVSTQGGWSATVPSSAGTSGEIVITAPDVASPTQLVMTATAADGRKSAAVLPVMVRDPYTDATRTDIPAMAYYGFYNDLATDYHFQMLTDGGFNMISIESVDDWKKQLDLCQAHGVKGVLFVNGPAGDYYRDGTSTKLRDIVNVAKNHPALAAYQIADEPSVLQIPQLKYEKEAIEAMDPDHPIYINLHPGHAADAMSLYGTETYAEYVERYVTDCNLEFITFDQYPVFTGRIDPTWYMTLQVISSTARKHNIPFWAFTCCCREWNREDPTLENIRLQCNTNLAFGAQVNQFFVYRSTSGTDLAPLQTWEWRNGSKVGVVKYTEAYDYCKAYNAEMHSRGWVFSGCNVRKIRASGEFDTAVESLSILDLPPQLKSLYTSRMALVSFIENKGNEYVVVVNSLWNSTQTVKVEVNEMIYSIDHDGVFEELQPGLKEYTLEGGDMIVLKVK